VPDATQALPPPSATTAFTPEQVAAFAPSFAPGGGAQVPPGYAPVPAGLAGPRPRRGFVVVAVSVAAVAIVAIIVGVIVVWTQADKETTTPPATTDTTWTQTDPGTAPHTDPSVGPTTANPTDIFDRYTRQPWTTSPRPTTSPGYTMPRLPTTSPPPRW